MVSVADEIVIRISADLQKFKGEILAAIGETKNFKREIEGVDRSSQILNQGLRAFSWTTFAQGALNASTAIVQVATSFSNLERVQYQVKASMVSVEKAEDQLARKTLQLNKEIEKHGILSEKATLLMNEIETASEQLATKQERLKIAQGNVNETYALFFSNIANTGFGVMQTLVGMYGALQSRKLLNVATTRIETGVTNENTAANIRNSIGQNMVNTGRAVGVGPIAGLIGAQTGLSASNVAVTATTRALTGALFTNPFFLPAAMIAATAGLALFSVTMAKLDSEMGNTTTAINDLSSSMDTGSIVVGDYSGGISDLGDMAVSTTEQLHNLRLEIEALETKQKNIEGKGDHRAGRYTIPQDQAKEKEKIDKELASKREQEARIVAQHTAIVARDLQRQALNEIFRGGDVLNLVKGGSNPALSSVVLESMDAAKSMHTEITELVKEWGITYEQAQDIVISNSNNLLTNLGLERESQIAAIDLARKRADAEEHLGKTMDLNYQKELKYLREIGQLKKKTSQRYIEGLRNSLFESVSAGEYGLSEQYLESLIGSRSSDVGYIPFSGSINKRLKTVTQNLNLIGMSNTLASQTAMLELLVGALAGTDPRDPKRKQILADIEAVNKAMKQTTSGRNISSLPGVHADLKMLSGLVTATINEYKTKTGSLFVGDLKSGAFGAAVGLWGITTPEMRSRAFDLSSGRMSDRSRLVANLQRSINGTNISTKKVNNSRSARARRGGHGGRNYDPLGGMGLTSAIESEARRGVIEQMMFLGGIIGVPVSISGTGTIDISGSLRGYRSPSANFVNAVATAAIENYRASVQRYNTQLSVAQHDILTRVNPLGITTISGLYESVTNPLTYDDVDNRLRYNDRLAQISTGATVI